MSNITLDDRDLSVLASLRRGPATVEALADAGGHSPGFLRDRLPELADKGLVRETDPEGYELTPSGMRLLAAASGERDERIDTPEHVERRIEALDLPPDEEDAVRTAFTFLRYWGEATASEIRNGVYSEHPAGYGSADEWWEWLEGALASLPDVEPPGTGETWQYAGVPLSAEATADGRQQIEDAGAGGYGSVEEALERRELSEGEENAVGEGFAFLRECDDATEAELRDRLAAESPVDVSADERWAKLRDALAALPEIEPPGAEGGTWRYREPDE